jgi:hypothetical protein
MYHPAPSAAAMAAMKGNGESPSPRTWMVTTPLFEEFKG